MFKDQFSHNPPNYYTAVPRNRLKILRKKIKKLHFICFDNETRCESAVYEYKNSLTIVEMIREMPSWSENLTLLSWSRQ